MQQIRRHDSSGVVATTSAVGAPEGAGAAGAAAVCVGWTVTTNKGGDVMGIFPLNVIFEE